MMNDLLQQGIAAFQAGDRAQAKEILEQVVAAEPNNDNAWYYLAAAQTNMAQRKEYLRRVLAINPEHPRARDVLSRMEAEEIAAEGSASAEAAGNARRSPPPVIPLNAARGRIPGEAASGGFVLPINIPDAPARVDFATLMQDGIAILRSGLDILQRKPGAYSNEVNQATWWRFWLCVGTGAVLIALFATLQSIVSNIQLSAFSNQVGGINILGILLTLLLTAPLQLLIFYAGCYVSHYWASRQGVNVPLYQHSYTIAVPYMTAQVITVALTAVLSIIGLQGIGGLISFFLSIYALYIVSFGFDMLYTFRDPNQKWITLAMFFAGLIVVGIVVSTIFVGLGVVSAISFL